MSQKSQISVADCKIVSLNAVDGRYKNLKEPFFMDWQIYDVPTTCPLYDYPQEAYQEVWQAFEIE